MLPDYGLFYGVIIFNKGFNFADIPLIDFLLIETKYTF